MKMYHRSQKYHTIKYSQYNSYFFQKSPKLSYLINDRIQKIRITSYPFRLEVDRSISKPDRFQFKERSASSAASPLKRILCHPKIARPDFTNRERRRRNDPPLRRLTDRFPSKQVEVKRCCGFLDEILKNLSQHHHGFHTSEF